ncbi:MAG TPA: tRNA guanosine(15) transglycosylase TgtA [Thermoplasmata archaeon]|nr:tRNA guanosine(15) transglycosylase TgtA [Thermoplasmata archaeon]
MPAFEVLERDGLARLGRFQTPHGRIDTPALLPVVHPDPARQPCPASELRERFDVRALITSAYITWRTPPLRAVAEREGIHRLLRFDGAVMTDSGAFQQHAYGSVEVGPEEILEFQGRIGSDIATVLDIFTEPDAPYEEAEAALGVTIERSRAARIARQGLLAIPVQGGPHATLRARSAAAASEGGDVLAVGGVVPLLEQYRFRELADVLSAVRPSLNPGAAVHLFGTGHPMTFAFAALHGVDLFDSSAYHKFARRGKLLFPEGTVSIETVRESICRCALCARTPLERLAALPPGERETHLALHNLLVSFEEVARVRQAIREGTLWELCERRAAGHPALRAGLRLAASRPETFWPTEPESRRAFREVSGDSRNRPAIARFLGRVRAFTADRPLAREIPAVALRPEYLSRIPTLDRSDRPISWNAITPLGPIPLELTELYPVGPYLGIQEFEAPRSRWPPTGVSRELADRLDLDADLDRDWTGEWTGRQLLALLDWQFGRDVAAHLAPELRGERSRRTGRLRKLLHDGAPAFVLGDDSVPRPTFLGAGRLHAALAPGQLRVVVADDAVPFVREGRSLFSKFVASADPSLVPGSSALLVDRGDELLAAGRLLLAPHEMGRLTRGVAVHVTTHRALPEPPEEDPTFGEPLSPPRDEPD